MSSVLDAIKQAAAANGVPYPLAVAIAQVESGLNPAAVGDNGHSIGLYQLNDAGEGAGLSVQQRQDPTLNASIALRQVGQVLRANPGINWGTAAARAQRPADQNGYAAKVNAALNGVGAISDAIVGAPASVTGSPVDAKVPSGINPCNPTSNFLDGASGIGWFVGLIRWAGQPCIYKRFVLYGISGGLVIWGLKFVGVNKPADTIVELPKRVTS